MVIYRLVQIKGGEVLLVDARRRCGHIARHRVLGTPTFSSGVIIAVIQEGAALSKIPLTFLWMGAGWTEDVEAKLFLISSKHRVLAHVPDGANDGNYLANTSCSIRAFAAH